MSKKAVQARCLLSGPGSPATASVPLGSGRISCPTTLIAELEIGIGAAVKVEVAFADTKYLFLCTVAASPGAAQSDSKPVVIVDPSIQLPAAKGAACASLSALLQRNAGTAPRTLPCRIRPLTVGAPRVQAAREVHLWTTHALATSETLPMQVSQRLAVSGAWIHLCPGVPTSALLVGSTDPKSDAARPVRIVPSTKLNTSTWEDEGAPARPEPPQNTADVDALARGIADVSIGAVDQSERRDDAHATTVPAEHALPAAQASPARCTDGGREQAASERASPGAASADTAPVARSNRGKVEGSCADARPSTRVVIEVEAPGDRGGGGAAGAPEREWFETFPVEKLGPPAESVIHGCSAALAALRQVVAWPWLYGKQADDLGLRWPRGVLLHGPSGCGKTALVHAVAAEHGAAVVEVVAGSVYGGYVGESERRLREVFAEANERAARGERVLLLLEEIDVMCPEREGHRPHEVRVVSQLLTLLDGAASSGVHPIFGGAEKVNRPAVVATTTRPNKIDQALRRPGRLDREIVVPVPAPADRVAILRALMANTSLADGVSVEEIAEAAHGYTGADLGQVVREAEMIASFEAREERDPGPANPRVSAGLLRAAMKRVGPSITRGIATELKPARWHDVGGLDDVKARLQQSVIWPLTRAKDFRHFGLTPPRGVMLHGPPGCSKTLLVRACATESGITIVSLSCAQLFSQFVGEGEAQLREVFSRARLAAPCILFLDEIDAVAPRRQGGSEGGSEAAYRLLSVLLTEMDGMELATGVLVVGATNRPYAIDPAMLRPGRLEVHLFVPPPDLEGREAVLRIHTRRNRLADDVDLSAVARATEKYTGAELEAVCREAAMSALREDVEHADTVRARHFEEALESVRPGLTQESLEDYSSFGSRKGAWSEAMRERIEQTARQER
ncbi:unnamed protein product [Pedinophyceae sp. YPF-701]|nr:unnamed protein product [Pedinophyceae sp. YPF-701]